MEVHARGDGKVAPIKRKASMSITDGGVVFSPSTMSKRGKLGILNGLCLTPRSRSAGKRCDKRVAAAPGSGTKDGGIDKRDRYIPHRGAMNMPNANFNLMLDRYCGDDKEDSDGSKRFPGSSSQSSSQSNCGEFVVSTKPKIKTKEALSPGQVRKKEFRRTLAHSLGASAARVLQFQERDAIQTGMVSQPFVKNNRISAMCSPSYLLQDAGLLALPSTPTAPRLLRYISSLPNRVIEAQNLRDDFYLSLMDWGYDNLLAIGLGASVYIWNGNENTSKILLQLQPVYGQRGVFVTSVKFRGGSGGNSSHLAVGDNLFKISVWDVATGQQVRQLFGHIGKVGVLDWRNASELTSGSHDRTIIHYDLRAEDKGSGSRNCDRGSTSKRGNTKLSAHDGKVCGLLWSPDGLTLASGGNDHMLCVWDARVCLGDRTSAWSGSALALGAGGPLQSLPVGYLHRRAQPRSSNRDHNAAVKALAWSPSERGLLASGGGAKDRTIKTWNATKGTLLQSVLADVQVAGLVFNPFDGKELLSTHSFDKKKKNLVLWHVPTMLKLKAFGTAHKDRLLGLSNSPCGKFVASSCAANDICIWEVFQKPKSTGCLPAHETGPLARIQIR